MQSHDLKSEINVSIIKKRYVFSETSHVYKTLWKNIFYKIIRHVNINVNKLLHSISVYIFIVNVKWNQITRTHM